MSTAPTGLALTRYLNACARFLPRIYAAGLELPDVEPTAEDIASGSVRPTFQFGRFDIYWEIFDPYELDEPVAGSLADDLGDIYADLVEPLVAFDAGREADAVWQWKFNVRGHCGDHIVDALRAIHRAVHDHMTDDYNPQGEPGA